VQIALPVFIAIIAGIVALIIIIVVVIMVHLGNVADEEAATQKAKDEAVRLQKHLPALSFTDFNATGAGGGQGSECRLVPS
jgi:hypothetical protein